ncbi:hypothetical protein QL093DRAFT_2372529 [Fusarium oxysporum]|nr:hypothetical protein QL093DRAFT_2372529 [Fusarium oxysporum]
MVASQSLPYVLIIVLACMILVRARILLTFYNPWTLEHLLNPPFPPQIVCAQCISAANLYDCNMLCSASRKRQNVVLDSESR